jgi:hypothetical protein
VLTVQAILIARVYTMYMGHRRIKYAVLALYILCAMSAITVVSIAVRNVKGSVCSSIALLISIDLRSLNLPQLCCPYSHSKSSAKYRFLCIRDACEKSMGILVRAYHSLRMPHILTTLNSIGYPSLLSRSYFLHWRL